MRSHSDSDGHRLQGASLFEEWGRICRRLCGTALASHTTPPDFVWRSGSASSCRQPPGAILGPQEAPQAPSYGFGRPLQGDDYPLEYYEDGYPKLPAPLDRRVRP